MKTLWLMGIGLLITFFACERITQPRLGPKMVTLQPAAVLVTEAWLAIEAGREDPTVTVVLERDGHIVHQVAGLRDTVLADSGLQPHGTYNYQLRLYREGQLLGRTRSLQITTLDTTSHDFEWEIIEFPSPFGSGALYDVAIINENDIWAVGEIYADSVQPWLPYNAVHWDGEKWELKRINFYLCPNGTSPIPYPIQAIFAFSQDDIWFTRGGSIVHWDGLNFKHDCSINSVMNGSIYKLWGTASNNLYGVGANGTIVYYDGQSWHLIESGTDLGLTDIWGKSENEICAVGLHYGQVLGVVLKYNGHSWEKLINGAVPGSGFDPGELFKTQLYGTTEGVWIDEMGTIYTVGNFMYQYRFGRWNFVRTLPENFIGGNTNNIYRGYLHAIRGNASNDIFIFGESNTIIHFNGMSWRKIGPPYVPWSYHFWYSCDVKGDLIVGVGKTSGRPFPMARLIKIWRKNNTAGRGNTRR